MERYPGEPVWLVHRSRAAAGYYGIAARDPLKVPPSQVTGLLAVSLTRLAVPSAQLRELTRRGVRVDEVGHSIVVYRLPAGR